MEKCGTVLGEVMSRIIIIYKLGKVVNDSKGTLKEISCFRMGSLTF